MLARRVLRHVQGVVGGGRPTPGHDLDLGSPGSQVLPRGGQHLVAAIGDEVDSQELPLGHRAKESTGALVRPPAVAVSGGLRDHGAARVNPRPDRFPRIDRSLEVEHGATHVACRREAAEQHPLRFLGCPQLEGFRGGLGVEHVVLAAGTMKMCTWLSIRPGMRVRPPLPCRGAERGRDERARRHAHRHRLLLPPGLLTSRRKPRVYTPTECSSTRPDGLEPAGRARAS
jgi:hypothetical protein